jgi:hypothetical protein
VCGRREWRGTWHLPKYRVFALPCDSIVSPTGIERG